jgi:hypothetical protein
MGSVGFGTRDLEVEMLGSVEEISVTEHKETKCAHPACRCITTEHEKYCSQYCKDAGSSELEIACDCGHPSCS